MPSRRLQRPHIGGRTSATPECLDDGTTWYTRLCVSVDLFPGQYARIASTRLAHCAACRLYASPMKSALPISNPLLRRMS